MGRILHHRTGGTCRLSLSRCSANIGRVCQNGGMFVKSQATLENFGTLPSSAEVSPANPFQKPGNAVERATPVISGLKCYESSGICGPLGYLVRTLLTSQIWNSTRRYLTWKIRVTKSNHSIFQLVASMPGTRGNGSSLLPTPDTMPKAPNKNCNRKYPKNLLQAAQDRYIPSLLPTPSALNGHNCGTFQEWGGAWNTIRGTALASGKVNPMWEEWLMGFPRDWTNLDDKTVATLSEMPSSRSKSIRSSKRLQTLKKEI